MSCGRNRRRSTFSSTINNRSRKRHESVLVDKRSALPMHDSSRSRKSNHPEHLSKQTSRGEDMVEFDRFRILNETNNDVTPRPIVDYMHVKIKGPAVNDPPLVTGAASSRPIDKQESSVSDKSVLGGATNLTNSISHMASTLFSAGGGTTLDIGTRMILESQHVQSGTLGDRTVLVTADGEESPATFLPGLGLRWVDLPPETVLLTETETIFILELTSTVVSQVDADEYNQIQQQNQIYTELCKNRQGNDLYIERGMQTFNNLSKHEHILTDPVFIRSEESWANAWDMHDSLVEANQHQGKIYRQNTKRNQTKSDGHSLDDIDVKLISNKSSGVLSSQTSSGLLSQESFIKITPSKLDCFGFGNTDEKKVPIDVDAFVMERILNLGVYQMKQAVYRGLQDIAIADSRTSMINLTSKNSSLPLIQKKNIRLEHLWHYTSDLTHNRNVSCLSWNTRNKDLLAVGYGKFQYNDDKEGLVCCWNAKNPEFPERYYQTSAGVTSLAFSIKHPNLLAVGLFNGNICMFDLNRNNTVPIVDTNEYSKKHTNSVWQMVWNEQDRSSEMENIEVLVSISADGRVTQWILRKDFEASDYIRLKRYNVSQTICQNDSDGLFSRFVGGLCFDMLPTDRTIYLCGTDEGLIHRCSTVYNEQYLESYVGHTGPVYKVHWSPFVPNLFLSASADWTVRLWMIKSRQPCMTFSSENSKAFFDAIWSPKSATMFCCINENFIEIWDLAKSTLDPIYVANCPPQVTLTSITYAANADCILVGTSTGAVWIYHLENPPIPTSADDLIAIVQQSRLESDIDTFRKDNLDG